MPRVLPSVYSGSHFELGIPAELQIQTHNCARLENDLCGWRRTDDILEVVIICESKLGSWPLVKYIRRFLVLNKTMVIWIGITSTSCGEGPSMFWIFNCVWALGVLILTPTREHLSSRTHQHNWVWGEEALYQSKPCCLKSEKVQAFSTISKE